MGVLAFVGTGKGLFLIDGTGVRGPLFPGERFPAVALAPDGRVIAASVSEHWGPTLRLSDDFGHTWTEHDEQAIAFPEGLEWTDHWSGQTKPAALVQVWQLRMAGDGVVYAGTEPAGLFRSTDGGGTFELMRGLWDHPHRSQWFPGGGGLGLHTILIDPRDSERLHVAISTGGVYRSDDGGRTWIPRNAGILNVVSPDEGAEFGQCVHKVDRDATHPDVLYLQNHGGLYRSVDRGDTWTSIADGVPSDFGFPIVAHPRRAGTAYVIPLDYALGRCVPEGKARVYRTIDSGASWQVLADGLPQDHAMFTVLRDGFCADDAEPTGLWFGTRSGHVFHSPDEGEHWRMAAEYLPDVLCVRAVAR
ncbi:MAG: WD40/YVTN/BNR-like repeat-containing protein [Acidimicrobiales bacterium]